MTAGRQDSELAELLSALGQVSPPSSDALENAREVLWSAVVAEVLSTGDARTGHTEQRADQPQQTAPQRRPDRSSQAQQRRNASPGA
jgi:hypothetical protein